MRPQDTGFFERWTSSFLKELIFVPGMLHAASNPLMRAGGQIQRKPAKLDNLRKATSNLASSDRDTFIGSSLPDHPTHVIIKRRVDKTHPCRRPTPT